MNYHQTALSIYETIGKKENLISATHCATRLRLVLADEKIVSLPKIEEIDGVKGVFRASGQLQIIIGTGSVNKVFEEFAKLAGIENISKEDVKEAAKQNIPWYQRAIKTLGDVFVPIIPAIVASGLLMGLLEGLANVFPDLSGSSTYTIFHLFSNASFVFLPILIAVSAAHVFGGNLFLGAVIGMIMIHPDLMNAWSVATAETIESAPVWFGLYHINLVGYQGHVIPVVIAVWFMCQIEKRLHKIVPEIIDLFVTPLVTVLVTGYLTLTIFGPVFSTLENWILDGVQYLISIPSGIGAFLIGGIYAPTVVAGIHHMYNALEAGMLAADGVNTWMPIATAANVAQGAAALALALKTKQSKTRSLALPASLSAFLGITEPAIFGVNLRYFRCFLAGCIGGAAGGLVAGLTHAGASAYGITGLFGYLITTANTLSYTLIILISFATAFLCSWIFFKDETSKKELKSPLKGSVIPLSEVPDETFSSGALGEGLAILPTGSVVHAPFDGVVSMLYETKHAIGLTSNSGLEVLIHVGINTVELNGEPFQNLVSKGEKIKTGQPLLRFDASKIVQKGYSLMTPIILTLPEQFRCIDIPKYDMIDVGETLFYVS